jgi:hypothetical protein
MKPRAIKLPITKLHSHFIIKGSRELSVVWNSDPHLENTA